MRVSRRLRWLLVVLLTAVLVSLGIRHWRGRPVASGLPTLPGMTAEEARRLVEAVEAVNAREAKAETDSWGPELAARQRGSVIDELWDRFNDASPAERWELLQRTPVESVRLPVWAEARPIAHGVETFWPADRAQPLDGDSWRGRLAEWQRAGWNLVRVEFRHREYVRETTVRRARSRYAFSAWVEHPASLRRLALAGELVFEWPGSQPTEGAAGVGNVDAAALTGAARTGTPPFQETLFEEVSPPERSHFIDPLVVLDLDADGRDEILLPAANRVYQLDEAGRWQSAPLFATSPGLLFTATFGDFDGDGGTDALGLRADGLWLFVGGANGRFETAPRQVWIAPERIRYGQVLATGDIDGDADLDLWLGQYKPPYERGQMPTPYYDAKDGYPSYLLVNDGRAGFTDKTAEAGLADKRRRRTYSASFVDLNGDRALDLLVVSDFAGADLYLNDGAGRFRDARAWFPEPHGFGMAHSLADFDGDGRIDVLMTGMECPTAARLESMGLKRRGFESLDAQRGAMTRGNRLFLGRGDRFADLSLAGVDAERGRKLEQSLASTGWSWSCPAADFDNDGFTDLYVANGHETKQSTVDYEAEFWLHDIYVGNSQDDLTLAAYFGAKFGRTRGQGQSYGGYEANRLLLNQAGARFQEVGWLLGTAVEQDSRNAVAADLEGDGRVDLVVTTFEAWPRVRQTVRVLRNQTTGDGNWIGVRLAPAAGVPAIGSQVIVETTTGRFVHPVVTGDAHRTQSPWNIHVGLGPNTQVSRIRVESPGGRAVTLETLAINRYHVVPLRP